MNQALHLRGLWSLDALTSSDAQTLLSTAKALKQAKGGSAPLKGKHVALLREQPAHAAADVFTSAARGLGAQVTHIRPSASRLSETDDLRDAARVLGRLYDAIECDGMGQAFMLELARMAAVPVCNVLLKERHPTRMLADIMTMQEIGAEPFDTIMVRVVDDERAPWSAAWLQMATVTGIGVVAGNLHAKAVPAEQRALPVAFVCDPKGARCADGQPALVALRRDDPRAVSLAQRQVANHRFVVQALLTQIIN